MWVALERRGRKKVECRMHRRKCKGNCDASSSPRCPPVDSAGFPQLLGKKEEESRAVLSGSTVRRAGSSRPSRWELEHDKPGYRVTAMINVPRALNNSTILIYGLKRVLLFHGYVVSLLRSPGQVCMARRYDNGSLGCVGKF